MSLKRNKEGKKIKNDQLTCKPLNSLKEIMMFLENPPPWRTLCKKLTPHSKYMIQNKDTGHYFEPSLERPECYCHFDPDAEAQIRYDVTEKKLPKTLVCHDFANGYHEDCLIEGTTEYDAYTFYNWAGIDIFCYFSHHLITIPPVGWINIGHDHGVKVIGTIISEWTEGVQFWDNVLASEESYRNFASAVVAIAKTLNFDGWLLNIENKITKPQVLLEFVQHLHKTLHEELEDPVLIWYDSVTIHGNLNWQNGLNEKNEAFFKACDGFFTNYSWSVADVANSVLRAGDRVTDLYIGLDVWGRNFYGGGQFNTQEAIKVAHGEGCSLAIFAPGWTHEAMSDDINDPNNISLGDHLPKLGKFQLRDRALWGSIWPFLNTRLPCQLPFQTSFCRGQGKKRRMYGEVISPGPWFNLRHQHYQPNAAHGPHGYMLSTYEKIMQVTHTAINKDKKGIIKYRESFQMLRNEINSIRNDGENSEFDVTEETPTRRDSFQSYKSDYSDYTPDPINREHKESSLQTMKTCQPDSDDKIDPEVIDNTPPTTAHKSDTEPKPIMRNISSKLKRIFKQVSWHKAQKNYKSNKDNIKLTDEDETGVASTVATCSTAGTMSMTESTSSPGMNLSAVTSSLITERDFKDEHNTLRQNGNTKDVEPVELKGEKGRSMVSMSIKLNLKPPQLKTRWILALVEKERECLQIYYEDSFNGGACIKVNPSDRYCTEHRVTRLFHCDFFCENKLIICVVSKTLTMYMDQSLNIMLTMVNVLQKDLEVVLLGRALDMSSSLDTNSSGIKYSYPIFSEEQSSFRELRQYLLLNQPDFYVPIDNYYGWQTRYYVVHVPGSYITSVNCRTALPRGGILLGHFAICAMK